MRAFYLKKLFLPKPKGYIKLNLPQHKYKKLPKNYPFSFEYSSHAYIETINKGKKNEYWMNICYPSLNAKIYITHKFVNNDIKLLKEYYSDANKLISKHYIMASSIKEREIKTKNGTKVIFVELSGSEIASQCQFFTSDYKKNFLMGSLYFNKLMDQEYIKPIIIFLKEDILHLINTLEFY